MTELTLPPRPSWLPSDEYRALCRLTVPALVARDGMTVFHSPALLRLGGAALTASAIPFRKSEGLPYCCAISLAHGDGTVAALGYATAECRYLFFPRTLRKRIFPLDALAQPSVSERMAHLLGCCLGREAMEEPILSSLASLAMADGRSFTCRELSTVITMALDALFPDTAVTLEANGDAAVLDLSAALEAFGELVDRLDSLNRPQAVTLTAMGEEAFFALGHERFPIGAIAIPVTKRPEPFLYRPFFRTVALILALAAEFRSALRI